MEKVKALDQELQRIYKDEMWGSQFVSILLIAIIMILMICPFEEAAPGVLIPQLGISCMSVYYYLRPYMVVEGVSVFQKLKWMPVTRKEICAVRMEYLNRRCRILFIIGMLLHQIGALGFHTFGWKSIVEVMAFYFVIWLFGVCQIYLAK